jgi:signal transduction histidine kinase
MMSSKAIEVEFSSPDEPVICEIDAVRIRQAFQNILYNAFHHSPKKGLIKVSVLEGEEGITISVIDSGSGISPEHLPHVFNRFYQADSIRSRENGGVGLGLAIAQANVQSHGGEITAESAGEGLGSTFRIKLP